MRRTTIIRSDLMLLLAAIIWGFAFVAQRLGMEHIGPFLFNAIRFGLGAVVIMAVLKFRKPAPRPASGPNETGVAGRINDWQITIVRGFFIGLILFAGATFQQVGIVYTTAGNAGFITGLYVIFVPLFGIFSNQKAGVNAWGGAILAVIGMYFLSVTADFTISKGDFLVLISAVFFAIHVLYTGWLSPKHSALKLALVQYTMVSVLSFFSAFFFEENTFRGVWMAAWPLLYGGILSVGIAYTLQIIGQKKAPPTHAAIILSMESVFAVIGGVVMLSEVMTERKWIGCTLMLCGMLLAQVKWRNGRQ